MIVTETVDTEDHRQIIDEVVDIVLTETNMTRSDTQVILEKTVPRGGVQERFEALQRNASISILIKF